jgi:hypothetical protein
MKKKLLFPFVTTLCCLFAPAPGTRAEQGCIATYFYFNGTSEADYYIIGPGGWTIYTTQPSSLYGDKPCLISHPSIRTVAALVSELLATPEPTIEEKLSAIGASIYNYKEFPEY